MTTKYSFHSPRFPCYHEDPVVASTPGSSEAHRSIIISTNFHLVLFPGVVTPVTILSLLLLLLVSALRNLYGLPSLPPERGEAGISMKSPSILFQVPERRVNLYMKQPGCRTEALPLWTRAGKVNIF